MNVNNSHINFSIRNIRTGNISKNSINGNSSHNSNGGNISRLNHTKFTETPWLLGCYECASRELARFHTRCFKGLGDLGQVRRSCHTAI